MILEILKELPKLASGLMINIGSAAVRSCHAAKPFAILKLTSLILGPPMLLRLKKLTALELRSVLN